MSKTPSPADFVFTKAAETLDFDFQKRNIASACLEFSWDTPAGSSKVDLDILALVCKNGATKPILIDKHALVFYNNKKTLKGGITCPVDSRGGESSGVDEYMTLNFDILDTEYPDWDHISLVLYAQPDSATGAVRHFRDAVNCQLLLSPLDGDKKGNPLVQMNLGSKDEYNNATLIVAANITRASLNSTQIAITSVFDAYEATLPELIGEYTNR